MDDVDDVDGVDGENPVGGPRAAGGGRGRRPARGRMRHEDYARLLAFRTTLRRFTRWSEEQAKAVGLTPAQHQLLLAVKGHDDPRGPSVGDVAEHLLLRQHSALELVDRAVAAGLLERHRDETDRRVVRLALTPQAEQDLEALTLQHLDELRRLAPALGGLVEGLE